MTEERKAAERLLFRGLALVVALVAAFWLLPQVWDKLSPFIIAVPLAALLQPVIGFLRKRLKMKPGLASVFPVVLLVCIIIGFLIWLSQMLSDLLPQLVGQSGNLITEAVTTLRQAASNLLESTASNFSPEAAALMRDSLNNMTSRLSQWGSDAATQLVSFTVTLATSLPYGMIYLSFLAMALYFIAKNYPEIRSFPFSISAIPAPFPSLPPSWR